MKKVLMLVLWVLFPFGLIYSQSFKDNFDSYNVGDYLGKSSSTWTTWNVAPGTSEDCYIVNDKFYSDSNSIYFYSASGGGPQDVVLPFGGVHTTGIFKFTSMFYIPSSGDAYFNFQGASSVGSTWALDVYFNANATVDIGSYISTNYPQDRWFKFDININLDSNDWEVFIDGSSAGSFSNGTNAVSHLDIYPVQAGEFWMDDVGYCVNYACNPELALSNLKITPVSNCSGHTADVSLQVKNNGPEVAKSMILGLDMPGQKRTTINVDLKNLKVGDSTTLTLKNAFRANAIGKKLTVSAINVSRDLDETNDTAKTTIDVIKSPKSEITKGTVFNGQFKKGTASDPDITEVGKNIQYEFAAPQGYANSGYNSDWKIESVTATSPKGNNISTFWTLTAPSSVNGYLMVTPPTGYLDSIISLCIVVKDLKTGCDSTMCRYIVIAPTPKANFKFPASTCDGDAVQFTNLSSVYSGSLVYNWLFDDGDSNDYMDPVHYFPSSGTYCVKLIVTSYPYLITHDTTLCVTISEIPVADFKIDNACEGDDVIFTDSSSVKGSTLTYDWDFGDGTAHSKLKNPKHKYAKPDGYPVTLVVSSSNGCKSQQTRNAFQFAKPVANFNYNGSCTNTAIQFSDISTISTSGTLGRNWNFYDGKPETLWNPKHVFTTSGSNSVTLYSISNFGCIDSVTKVLDISPGPMTDFTFGQVCDAKPTEFTNTTTEPSGVNVTYNWQFGDGAISTAKSPSHQFKDLQQFTVELTARGDNGCSSTIKKDVTVKVQPIVDFKGANTCEDDPLQFENKTNVRGLDVKYLWTFGDGDTSTLFAPSKKYNITETTFFGVTLKASVDGGCSDSKTISIKVSETPDCGFTTTQVGGNLLTYIFKADSTEYPFYQWRFGDLGTANGSNPTFTFANEGTYKITIIARTADGCQCMDSSQSLVVKPSSIENVFANSTVKVMPNPSSGRFTISFNNAYNPNEVTIQMIDAVGRLVYSKNTFRSTDNLIQLDTEHLKNGIYYLTVSNGDLRTTQAVQIVK